ncbi:MAG TPA: sulfatase, partial [Acidobacteriota bacterium]
MSLHRLTPVERLWLQVAGPHGDTEGRESFVISSYVCFHFHSVVAINNPTPPQPVTCNSSNMTHTKKIFIVAFMSLSASLSTIAQAKQKYNVLFIISDDLRPELGAYGVSQIKTPNIDRIAARGTRFDNAYAQYPVCNPSRTSFLTGLYPSQTGVWNNNDYFRRIHPSLITLPEYFKQNGYVTLRSGKIFHGGIDDMQSWTQGGEPTDSAITERGKKPAIRIKESGELPDAPGNQPLSKSAASDRIIILEGNGEDHGDYKTATRAISMMERYKSQPFFLAVGFGKPHSPPTAPKKFFDLYDVNKIELPVDFATKPQAPPGFPEISISKTNSDLFIGRESTPALAREMKRAYYASTSFMDAQVGRVMEALEKNNLQHNTIVVFFGDHGYHLGEKGKWSKAYSLYELGLRVPLIIAVPKGKTQHSTRIVDLIDLYPTLIELCGLPKKNDIEGHSLAPLLKDPNAARNFPSYGVTEVRKSIGRSVRTK